MEGQQELGALVLRFEAARAHLVSALGRQVVDIDEVQAARQELHSARKELHGVLGNRRREARARQMRAALPETGR